MLQRKPYCGGQGIYLYHLTRELAKLGVEIDAGGPPYPDPMDEWARVIKVENPNLWCERTRRIPTRSLLEFFSI